MPGTDWMIWKGRWRRSGLLVKRSRHRMAEPAGLWSGVCVSAVVRMTGLESRAVPTWAYGTGIRWLDSGEGADFDFRL